MLSPFCCLIHSETRCLFHIEELASAANAVDKVLLGHVSVHLDCLSSCAANSISEGTGNSIRYVEYRLQTQM